MKITLPDLGRSLTNGRLLISVGFSTIAEVKFQKILSKILYKTHISTFEVDNHDLFKILNNEVYTK